MNSARKENKEQLRERRLFKSLNSDIYIEKEMMIMKKCYHNRSRSHINSSDFGSIFVSSDTKQLVGKHLKTS